MILYYLRIRCLYIKECLKKKRPLKQTNFAHPNAQPHHHWRLYDLLMLCQCAILSHWTQNELRMSKIHQGVSNRLKVSLELIFFWKLQFVLNNHNIVMKTNRFICFMTKSLKTFFWRTVLDFCKLFEFFIIKDLVFGFGHWPLSDRLFQL